MHTTLIGGVRGFGTERRRVDNLYKRLMRYLRGAEKIRSSRVGGSKIWSGVRKSGIARSACGKVLHIIHSIDTDHR